MKLKTVIFLLCSSGLVFANGDPLEIIGKLPSSNVMSFLSAEEQAKIARVNKNFKQAGDNATNINVRIISDQIKHLLKKIESNCQKCENIKSLEKRLDFRGKLKYNATVNDLRASIVKLLSKGIINSRSLAHFINKNIKTLGKRALDELLFGIVNATEEDKEVRLKEEIKAMVKQLEHFQQQLNNAEELNLTIGQIKKGFALK